MADVLLWAATIAGALLLTAVGVFGCWALVVVGSRWWQRRRCAVCCNGGSPADYPDPRLDYSGYQQGDYRLCDKHFGQQRKIRHLERRAGY